MALIELQNVNVGFGAAGSRTEVLRDINLGIAEGELVAIGVGERQLRGRDR
jgi:ABC-type microcin C transport system duplicated ATPase subunit YejF